MKKAILTIFFVVFLILSISPSHAVTPRISIGEQKVIYLLPHPGILPDHPLYFLKSARDNVQMFLTRDAIKKAELHLLLSDKHVSMAVQLQEKGKDQLAVETLQKGEEYFIDIIPILQESKNQGVKHSDDFMRKLQNSNIKHREVMEGMIKDLPQGSREDLSKVLEMNQKAQKDLEKLK